MVGIVEPAEFEGRALEVAPGDQLLVYSDGVFEIEKQDGEMWTFAEFVDWMSAHGAPGEGCIDRLLQHTRKLQRSDDFVDDFSILQVTF
jgi:sigma-B regulation protein RsbU (phosphoserine phosphatase)